MRHVTLEEVFQHETVHKHLKRSGIAHAIAAAYHGYRLARQYRVSPDLATKAALLHDIGHYTWFRNGQWDFDLYKENDIHAIKGAERAHRILIELGESRRNAKEISLAILLHTDSYLPEGQLYTTPLQKVVRLADEADEEPGGKHHYREIDSTIAADRIKKLDHMVNYALNDDEFEMKATV
ncbi:HD domain-containing protein [Bacillus marinisedimentorum]|uniref:HD domain-containing protein n=1 Tax=Bacillus marinisedimentorum TaxID=1821260 RepID=UPI000872630B|nr:HD domain-containing protein [Bacillus marinisedimentorum]